MYNNIYTQTFGAAEAVLFIKVSSLQGVLVRGVPTAYIHTSLLYSLLCRGPVCWVAVAQSAPPLRLSDWSIVR